ncbi:MAG: YfhO family protein [Deltaproteobacteria bacterium]|nr:YfhO family protein [Deltaproteobacteria bacterium]
MTPTHHKNNRYGGNEPGPILQPGRKKVFSGFLPLTVVVAAILFSYLDVIIAKDYIFDGELALVHYPFFKFTADTLAKGLGFPLWTKGVFMGFPMAYDPEIALFYPLNLPLLAFPHDLLYLINLVSIIHLVIAAAGAFHLARKLGLSSWAASIAAIVYSLNGFTISCISQLMALEVMAWIPFFIAMGLDIHEKGKTLCNALLAGLFLGLMLLAGMYQYVACGILLAVGWSVARIAKAMLKNDHNGERSTMIKRGVAGWITVAIIGTALSGIQLLPAVESSTRSNRKSITFQTACGEKQDRLRPIELLDTVAHFSFVRDDVKTREDLTLNSPFHLGTAVVLLAVIGMAFSGKRRLKWSLATITLLSFLVAAGPATPVFWIFYHLFYPLMFMFKDPNRYMFIAILPVAILAGMGADSIVRAKRRNIALVATVTSLFLLLVSVVARSRAVSLADISGLDPTRDLNGTFSRMIADYFFLALTWIACIRPFKTRLKALYVPLASLAAIMGLLVLGPDQERRIAHDEMKSFYNPGGMLEQLKAGLSQGQRYMASPYPLRNNLGLIHGMENASGQCSLIARRLLEFSAPNKRNRLDKKAKNTLFWDFLSIRPLARLASVGAVVISSGQEQLKQGLLSSGFKPAFSKDGYDLLVHDGAMPGAWLVQKAVPVHPGNALDAMLKPGFDPSMEAIVEITSKKAERFNGPGSPGRVISWINPGPGSLQIKVHAKRNSILMINQSWHPGWKAYVAGKETRIIRADHIFMAVPVSRGDRTVTLEFKGTAFFTAGLICTLSTILALLSLEGFFLWSKIRKRYPHP